MATALSILYFAASVVIFGMFSDNRPMKGN
jgi:hypothetical protein